MIGLSFSSLIWFALACATAAVPGVFFRPGQWYRDLVKPDWRPPDWLFGPVWLVLYLSIAVSGWLVFESAPEAAARPALTVYAVQLGLNGLWSCIFFGLKRPGWALAEICLLWLSIGATIGAFWPLHQTAALLLLPYLAWVSFAVLLNLSIWRLNPGRSSP
mgnify:CR=1 FL=1